MGIDEPGVRRRRLGSSILNEPDRFPPIGKWLLYTTNENQPQSKRSITKLSSCSRTLLKLYGIKATYTIVDDKNLVQLSPKYDIPLEDWYELDFSYYDFILSFDKDIYIEEKNNHLQPLQALYFNSEGKLISYHVNCDMGGVPNLNIFNTFLPNIQTKLDTIISLETLSLYLIPTVYSESFSHLNYDYIVVVIWSELYGATK